MTLQLKCVVNNLSWLRRLLFARLLLCLPNGLLMWVYLTSTTASPVIMYDIPSRFPSCDGKVRVASLGEVQLIEGTAS